MISFDPGVVKKVYFIQAGVGGPIKIGEADSPEDRLRALQTAHHEQLTLLATVDGVDESDMHGSLRLIRGGVS
jgi:hypothetical protein